MTTGAAQSSPQTSQTTGTNAPQEKAPDAANPASAGPGVQPASNGQAQDQPSQPEVEEDDRLVFHFAPDMKPLILPEEETLLEGTDSYVSLALAPRTRTDLSCRRWALHHGYISVTPLQASYAEPAEDSMCFGSEVGSARVEGAESNGEGKKAGKGEWKL